MSRDLVCVHRARDIGEADIIVAWLDEQGIASMVKDRYAVGTLQVPQIVAPRGIEVCVLDAQQADQARALLAQHAAENAAPSGTPIDATCEECGAITRFPAAHSGSVQSCPHCRAYIDIP